MLTDVGAPTLCHALARSGLTWTSLDFYLHLLIATSSTTLGDRLPHSGGGVQESGEHLRGARQCSGEGAAPTFLIWEPRMTVVGGLCPLGSARVVATLFLSSGGGPSCCPAWLLPAEGLCDTSHERERTSLVISFFQWLCSGHEPPAAARSTREVHTLRGG